MDFFEYPFPSSHCSSSDSNSTGVDVVESSSEVADGNDDSTQQKGNDSLCELFDVVCLCLVVNFVGDAAQRGAMLFKTTQHLRLQGHLVLILPLACTENSRYFSAQMLEELCCAMGFKVVERTLTAGLGSWLLQLTRRIGNKRQIPQLLGKFNKSKAVVRKGGKRNNFFISIDTTTCMKLMDCHK
eukprot:m.144531 g.144531  ORF g.144531 m.144531 type:complete len:185 (-) comp13224_c1_seq4:1338-1892(-)